MLRLVILEENYHGTVGGYINHLCRCDKCKSAWATRVRDDRLRRMQNIPDHVHGTQNGYGNYGCRCRPCTTAWSAAAVARAKRHRQLGDQSHLIGSGNRNQGRVTLEEANRVRERYSAGIATISQMAGDYEVSYNAIWNIVNNKTHNGVAT